MGSEQLRAGSVPLVLAELWAPRFAGSGGPSARHARRIGTGACSALGGASGGFAVGLVPVRNDALSCGDVWGRGAARQPDCFGNLCWPQGSAGI